MAEQDAGTPAVASETAHPSADPSTTASAPATAERTPPASGQDTPALDPFAGQSEEEIARHPRVQSVLKREQDLARRAALQSQEAERQRQTRQRELELVRKSNEGDWQAKEELAQQRAAAITQAEYANHPLVKAQAVVEGIRQAQQDPRFKDVPKGTWESLWNDPPDSLAGVLDRLSSARYAGYVPKTDLESLLAAERADERTRVNGGRPSPDLVPSQGTPNAPREGFTPAQLEDPDFYKANRSAILDWFRSAPGIDASSRVGTART